MHTPHRFSMEEGPLATARKPGLGKQPDSQETETLLRKSQKTIAELIYTEGRYTR